MRYGEDQRRPRRCGHADGKLVLPLEEYLEKLDLVLASRTDLLVVARTDATEEDEMLRRAAPPRAPPRRLPGHPRPDGGSLRPLMISGDP